MRTALGRLDSQLAKQTACHHRLLMHLARHQVQHLHAAPTHCLQPHTPFSDSLMLPLSTKPLKHRRTELNTVNTGSTTNPKMNPLRCTSKQLYC